MSRYRNFPKYESSLEIMERNTVRREIFLKRHKDAQPLLLSGKQVCKTWWGKAWNENLHRYSDYTNRLARGKRYVRGGAVFDIHIEEGVIYGYVGGSGNKTYRIDITIDACEKECLLELLKQSSTPLESIQDLLDGNFPVALKELLFDKKSGLFPSPQEIHIHCTCPDYAVVCKHVAALLYGVSVKLDENPSLFFLLRKLCIDDIVAYVVQDDVKQLLQGVVSTSNRSLQIEDIDSLFHLQDE